jgi:hypothetical protein
MLTGQVRKTRGVKKSLAKMANMILHERGSFIGRISRMERWSGGLITKARISFSKSVNKILSAPLPNWATSAFLAL